MPIVKNATSIILFPTKIINFPFKILYPKQ